MSCILRESEGGVQGRPSARSLIMMSIRMQLHNLFTLSIPALLVKRLCMEQAHEGNVARCNLPSDGYRSCFYHDEGLLGR